MAEEALQQDVEEVVEETPAAEEVAETPKVETAEPTEEVVAETEASETEEAAAEPQEKERVIARSTGKQSGERNWYVIHTYSGYEDQVAQNLRQRIDSLDMADKIFDVLVPIEKQIEIKNGKRRTVERKIFPGYVMVDMVVTDDSWFVVRNTPNVTGFIGFGVRPTPMSPTEVDNIRRRMGQDEPKYKIELKAGDLVQITDGALKGFQAKVDEVDSQKGKVKVLVSMFGRETPVSLDYLQLKQV
jgi:transcriptional antiterminator NusG